MKEESITRNIIKMNEYFCEMNEAAQRIDLETIEQAIKILYDAWLSGSKVFIVGNGGSASTASHFVCDLSKTTIVDGKKRCKVISLLDNIPLISALTNDEGFEKIYDEQLKAHLEPGDVVIAISVHGGSGQGNASKWSQNLLRAIDYANVIGASTIGLSGFDGGAMVDLCDICIVAPIDSTPHVESMHLTIEHLVCERLKVMIEESDEGYIS